MRTTKNSLFILKYKNIQICLFKEQLIHVCIEQILDKYVLQIRLNPKNVLNFPQKSFAHASWNELHIQEMWKKSYKHSEWRIM